MTVSSGLELTWLGIGVVELEAGGGGSGRRAEVVLDAADPLRCPIREHCRWLFLQLRLEDAARSTQIRKWRARAACCAPPVDRPDDVSSTHRRDCELTGRSGVWGDAGRRGEEHGLQHRDEEVRKFPQESASRSPLTDFLRFILRPPTQLYF